MTDWVVKSPGSEPKILKQLSFTPPAQRMPESVMRAEQKNRLPQNDASTLSDPDHEQLAEAHTAPGRGTDVYPHTRAC